MLFRSAAIRFNHKSADAFFRRGDAWRMKGEFDKALADYATSIRLAPDSPFAYDGRARIWATCSDASHRDGQQAVASATRACELTGCKNAAFLSTLAAAFAQAGNFDAAVKWQNIVQSMSGDEKDRDIARARLALYEGKKPYRAGAK